MGRIQVDGRCLSGVCVLQCGRFFETAALRPLGEGEATFECRRGIVTRRACLRENQQTPIVVESSAFDVVRGSEALLVVLRRGRGRDYPAFLSW